MDTYTNDQEQYMSRMNQTARNKFDLLKQHLTANAKVLDFDVTTYGATDNGIYILITDHYTRCTFKYIKYKRTPLSKCHDIPTLFTDLLPTLQEFIKCLRALYASQLKLHINSKQFNLIPYENKIIIMFLTTISTYALLSMRTLVYITVYTLYACNEWREKIFLWTSIHDY